MFKALAKLFIPSPKKLSTITADKIADTINTSEKQELIAKYASMALDLTNIQEFISNVLKDGKISDEEKKQIESKLEPLFTYLIEQI